MSLRSFWAASVLAIVAPAMADVTVHVSPRGLDSNPGTKLAPFGTLSRARDEIRALKGKRELTGTVTVLLHGGEYFLRKTLMLTPEDSGTETCPITWRSAPGATAVLRAAHEITGWVALEKGIFVTDLADQKLRGLEFSQLFHLPLKSDESALSIRLPMARHPNRDETRPLYGGFLYVDRALEGRAARSGFIYGKGDFEKTIRIATMAGWDADCNPSTAGGRQYRGLYSRYP